MKVDREGLKRLAGISIDANECDSPIEFTFRKDPAGADAVRLMVRDYGIWGWCDVIVTAYYHSFGSRSYMSECSTADVTTSARTAATSTR